MFDVAWSELALIGAVALIVIGPKDLPKVMRTVGQWVRKARLLAGEFHRGIDEMVRQAEMEELRRKVREADARAAEFGHMMEESLTVKAPDPAPPAGQLSKPADARLSAPEEEPRR